jgi:hypothetical protein
MASISNIFYGAANEPYNTNPIGTIGLYLNIGNSGNVAVSPDFVNWNNVSTVLNASFYEAGIWDGTKFIITGSTTAYSYDGIIWTKCNNAPGGVGIARSSSGLYMIVDSAGIIYTSNDGITWTSTGKIPPTSSPSGGVQNVLKSATNISWNGSYFVVSGNYYNQEFTYGYIFAARWISVDGLTWTRQDLVLNGVVESIAFATTYHPTYNDQSIYTDIVPGLLQPYTSITRTERGLIFNKVAVRADMSYNNGIILAVVDDGTEVPRMFTSTDFVNWTQRFFPQSWERMGRITFKNNTWYVSGRLNNSTNAGILKSTDTINWTFTNTGISGSSMVVVA